MEKENFLGAVYMIIKNEKGELLFGRRIGTKLWCGYLGLPAGHIDKGEDAYEALFREAKEELDIEIKQVLLNFPLFSANSSIETSEISVEGVVTGEHIKEVINKTVRENIPNNLEVLYLEPIVFETDSGVQVVDPKGLTTSSLEVRCAVATIEKEFLYQYLKMCE